MRYVVFVRDAMQRPRSKEIAPNDCALRCGVVRCVVVVRGVIHAEPSKVRKLHSVAVR